MFGEGNGPEPIGKLPPTQDEEFRVHRCVYGYCVSNAWMIQFGTHIGRNGSKTAESTRASTYLHLNVGVMREDGGGFGLVPIQDVYTDLVVDEGGLLKCVG